jgi:hypothetical protein
MEFDMQINTGKQSVLLVHGIFLAGQQRKGIEADRFGLQVDTKFREFIQIVADSRGDHDLH